MYRAPHAPLGQALPSTVRGDADPQNMGMGSRPSLRHPRGGGGGLFGALADPSTHIIKSYLRQKNEIN